MPRTPIHEFHSAWLSLVQSCLREVIGKQLLTQSGSGLAADHPVLQAAGHALEGIFKAGLTDARSAIEAFTSRRIAQRATATGSTTSAGTSAASGTGGIAEDCADLLAQYALAWLFHDTDRINEIESELKDSNCDPGWASAVIEWLRYYWDGRSPQYVPPTSNSPQPIPLPPPGSADGQLRVGLLGDWGTGEPEATAVLDQLMQQSPDLIIHVGDIYYSGTHDECINNFLNPIRAARSQYKRPIPVYNLPGNHDYYSGGAGFYSILPQINLATPNAAIQRNSFFSLYNDNWQLEGMDTGFNDHDLFLVGEDITHLEALEANWHKQRIKESRDRKVILLSHHQLFSAFEHIGDATSSGPSYENPFLLQNLHNWQKKGHDNIVAWLWGHEHLLEVYAVPGSTGVNQGLNPPILGRCIGNSAFPVFNNLGDYTPQPDSVQLEAAPKFPNGYVQTSDDGLVYGNGYALMTLGQNTGTIDYYQVDFTGSIPDASSQLLWTDTIPVS